MDPDIICVSDLSLPRAASKPNHAVRKAELDALAAAVATLSNAAGIEYTTPYMANGGTITIQHNLGSLDYIVDISIIIGTYRSNMLFIGDSPILVDTVFGIYRYEQKIMLTSMNSCTENYKFQVIVKTI